MGNRGQKRAELPEELPADKRACSSLEFRPSSSSNSSVQTQINSVNLTPETHGNDMETTTTTATTTPSSSSSVSSQSEEEPERDSTDGSCDSDGQGDGGGGNKHASLRDYQRRRSASDQGKIKRIVASLSEEGDGSGQLAALTELCEVLSFSTEDSMSTLMSDSLPPVLVKLAKHDSNPDIMLLAIRAITYMCDVFPSSSGFLVRHDAVPALCQRLMAIEYLDVAEQCLQALDKISRDEPLACLQSGAIMAALSFIDFFSTSVQRVALSTVVNICKKLPSECPSPFMEAVPILCNLLQYEDRQLVENAVTCLIKITDRVRQSPEMLDELCKHGLIHQATHLIDLNSRTTLGQPIHMGLIGLLVKLASGSFTAVRTLFELNISSILKDILTSYELSHGMPSQHMAVGHCNQVHEVLKLLNELLPTLARGDQDVQLELDKESFLVNQPDLLQNFGMNIITKLIQVVDSGANLYVCYGCLSVINKLVHFIKPDMLLELLKTINISSFLAGVLTRKDHHVLILALEITETVLQKLPDYFLNSFIKEGVFFAVDALITPEKCSQLMFPGFCGTQLSIDPSQKSASKEVPRCLCYASDTGDLATKTGNCKLEKDSVQNLAKRIWSNYFTAESHNPEKRFTEIFNKLKTFSAALIDLLNVSTNNDNSAEQKESFYRTMHQILEMLSGSEPISTFEFIESGIVKSLVSYLSNGLHMTENMEHLNGASYFYILERRFEGFAIQLLSLSGPMLEDLPLSVIIRKLLNALSSVENFPAILSHVSKKKNSYSTVPHGRCTTYPSLRVRFVRGEGETSLCDYSEDVMTVDPLCSVDAIEGFLWPKVNRTTKAGCIKSSANVPQLTESDSISSALRDMQVDGVNMSHSEPEEADNTRQTTLEEKHEGDIRNGSVKQELSCSSEADVEMKAQHPACSSIKDDSRKLSFYLEGHQLDRALTLYQTILQQEMKADNGMFNGEKLWTQVYTVTYKRTLDPKESPIQNGCQFAQNSYVSDKVGTYWQFAPFLYGMFDSELVSDLDKSSPTYNILFLLKSLERMNRFASHVMSHERIYAFAEGSIENLDNLKILAPAVPHNEFVNSKLTEKLEQQLRDPLAMSIGGVPAWCNQLMASCPFLFGFEARCKYFRLAAFGPLRGQPRLPSLGNSNSSGDIRPTAGGLARKKFLVCRDRILDSAAKMMDQHAHQKVILEVEYEEEVGTGLGPTLEFYTLVSHEFQKPGLGMWREDHSSSNSLGSLQNEDYGIVVSRFGLFPRPWSSTLSASNEILFLEVLKKFVLLGQVVAKALQDGRVLDVPLSRAFYKLILGQELSLYDIRSFDPELGRALIEFKALVDRKRFLDSACGVNSTFGLDSCFRDTTIEDLYLDFTLPGYPDYTLTSGPDYNMVYINNLEEYVSLIVDATIQSGIMKQVEAFRSGFNQVFPSKHLQIFTEEEIERLLCGERDSWDSNELLDHAKFDHGYTASSPPILNLLEIIQELDFKQRRAFLQFVTGAPRLPPGGLASLNPKLTIVRKHCSKWVDAELPSVMTCANYLKLPPYSSKERMKEKLLYAITEGQGSFHLS